MPTVRANSIDIFYDEVGDTHAPAIILVMGLGTQMIAWPEAFCQMLADRGFRVIRFDNRDVGLSTKLTGAPKVNIVSAIARAFMNRPVNAPYGLDDMADDLIGLMDAIGLDKAHIVGASMGGMIAQIVAAKYAERTRSLVSIMSSSGDPQLPSARPSAASMLTASRPPKNDREATIRFGVAMFATIGSPGYPTPEPELRARIERAIDRSNYPAGFYRQFLAVLASGSRVQLLKTINMPTLVMHGEDDPLVPVEAGRDTARHIPNATLEIIPGWGHDLPTALIPKLVERIATHCRGADCVGRRASD
jgi:pimeloyl-ACP methyl ester carboxylesterase